MALTRKLLKSFGLEESVIDSIIDAHTETVDALKQQRDAAQAEADKVSAITRERDDALEKLQKAGDAAKVQADFDAYKQQVENEKKVAREDADVLALCKDAGITRESSLRLVAKDFDRSKIKRGEDGSIANRDELLTAVKADYADFVGVSTPQGTPPHNPPAGGNSGEDLGTLNMADYIAARKKM